MRHLITAILTALLIHTVNPIQAQTPTPPTCDLASIYKKVSALKATNNAKRDLDSLLKLTTEIAVARASCNKMLFTGTKAQIIGPFDVAKGFYRVTVVSKGYFTARVKAIGTDCGESYEQPRMDLRKVPSSPQVEALLTVEHDCRVAFQPSDVSSPWTIAIEPITADLLIDLKSTCNLSDLFKTAASIEPTGDVTTDGKVLAKLSNATQTQAFVCNDHQFSGTGFKVIGPISLAAGSYKLVAKTKGFMIADAVNVDSGCANNQSPDVYLNKDSSSQEEEAILTVKSQCPTVLVISNTNDPWNLGLESLK